ncbi:hypothetical protein PNOK_0559300 [Pyrrhoderma noxium]|uniref:Uncharacterized protein n=1 Tax=Pyrrhoderma noxium TaxID=2282107 RepID=A0A286UGL1_9AGAM|nr:hypothetical protein PNOK_0559300 [Pyrrhoderma noxium]
MQVTGPGRVEYPLFIKYPPAVTRHIPLVKLDIAPPPFRSFELENDLTRSYFRRGFNRDWPPQIIKSSYHIVIVGVAPAGTASVLWIHKHHKRNQIRQNKT